VENVRIVKTGLIWNCEVRATLWNIDAKIQRVTTAIRTVTSIVVTSNHKITIQASTSPYDSISRSSIHLLLSILPYGLACLPLCIHEASLRDKTSTFRSVVPS
jgi:hypothetical protein